jgi:hemerythrin-like domain-containing protein
LKRAEALQSLSRDHHRALVVARRLRRADDPEEAAATFLEFWREDGHRHFRIEEEVLLPCWALLGKLDESAAAQLSSEHLRIRSVAWAIESGVPSVEQVRELADHLAAHVRFEERVLFPLIEQDLGVDELNRLASAVSEAEEQA